MSDPTEASAGPADRDRSPRGRRTVGIVGAGQLARMTCEAASALGIRTVVLAEHPDGGAASEVVVGSPSEEKDLRLLAERCDVVTFDHELVDLGVLAGLAAEGVVLRPGLPTLEMAVDKACMRSRLSAAGIPVPAYAVLTGGGEGAGGAAGAGALAGTTAAVAGTTAAVAAFAEAHGWPVVLKAARGGYDGRGVWPVAGPEEAREVCQSAAGAGVPLLVEELVPIDAELAVLVTRRPGGESVAWPPVETVQVDGMCREVLVPGGIARRTAKAATTLARRVADVAESVGVLAVELFATGDRLVVNEVAARPHNTGHWTIEGAVTSQFENHLRAVLDLPLGETVPTAPQVASVNVLGPADGSDPADRLDAALAVPGAHVHLYGKAARPGRKLGHVTVCGPDPDDVRARAWAAARTLGTPVPAAVTGVGDAAGGKERQ